MREFAEHCHARLGFEMSKANGTEWTVRRRSRCLRRGGTFSELLSAIVLLSLLVIALSCGGCLWLVWRSPTTGSSRTESSQPVYPSRDSRRVALLESALQLGKTLPIVRSVGLAEYPTLWVDSGWEEARTLGDGEYSDLHLFCTAAAWEYVTRVEQLRSMPLIVRSAESGLAIAIWRRLDPPMTYPLLSMVDADFELGTISDDINALSALDLTRSVMPQGKFDFVASTRSVSTPSDEEEAEAIEPTPVSAPQAPSEPPPEVERAEPSFDVERLEPLVTLADAHAAFLAANDKLVIRFIDAREPNAYALGHIAGALRLRSDEVTTESGREVRDFISGANAVIIYGADAELLAERLRIRGFPTHVLSANYQEWEDAGYPMKRGFSP